MKKNLIKCFISLGLFLLLTVILPELNPNRVATAYANTVEREKSDGYRLNLYNIIWVKGKAFPLPLKVYNLSETAKVSYRSADVEIATVSEDGIIFAKMVGTTTITANIKDGLNSTNLTCDVTVGPPAFSVKMTRSRIILGIEKSDSLSVILKPSNTAENAIFSSHDATIAYISPGGRATGKKYGFTYLFAKIDALNAEGKNKFAYCSTIVVNPEDVLPLDTYFYEHSELNMISEDALNSALSEFFNGSSEALDVTATPTPTAKTTETLVESLDKFLESRFKLSELRKELAAKTTVN